MQKTKGHLAAIIAASLATAVAAQTTPQPVEIGRVTQGRLAQAETRHALRLRAGETVRIAARSRDFDPMLKLYGPAGAEPLAQDDDSGGGTTAELTFSAETAGVYQIGVSISGSAEAPSGGPKAYDLTVVAAVTPVAAPPRAITPNSGQPTQVDLAQCGSGCRFTFQANAGDRLVAETAGGDSDADPLLELYRGGEKLAEDDDGGDGVNARLVRRIDQPGAYAVLARAYEGHNGTVSLTLTLRPYVARPAVPLTVGPPVTGTLTTDAEVADNARFYDSYTLHGRAGQRLTIDMASTAFDTVVELWGQTVLGSTQLATNDDADGSPGHRATTTNSRLTVTFARDGDVEVRASSLDKQGAYTLRVSEPAAR